MLRQKPVDCDCPAGFAAQILDTLPGSVVMGACLRCGRTDLAESVMTEDRPHDVAFHGFQFAGLSEVSRAWASAWPRFRMYGDRRVFLPPAVLFDTEEAIDAMVAALASRQKTASLRETLLSLGVPDTEPPRDLPEELEGFAENWRGLQLDPDGPVEDLLDAATRWNGPNRMAAEMLGQRPGLLPLAASLLVDPGHERRGWGRFLVRRFSLSGDAVLTPLRQRLAALDGNDTGEMQDVVSTLAAMGAAAKDALPEILAAVRHVEKRDYYMHQDLAALARNLEA